MSLHNIFNSVDIPLENNLESNTHSFVHDFINELQNYFDMAQSMSNLSNIPQNTLFTLDRYEGIYAVCENRTTGEILDIPKILIDPCAKNSDILKFVDGKYQIDYLETAKQKEISQNLINQINK